MGTSFVGLVTMRRGTPRLYTVGPELLVPGRGADVGERRVLVAIDREIPDREDAHRPALGDDGNATHGVLAHEPDRLAHRLVRLHGFEVRAADVGDLDVGRVAAAGHRAHDDV